MKAGDVPPAKKKRERPPLPPEVTRSLMAEIDKENNQKLERMSKEEILAAQKELAEALDPSLIEALRKLGRAKQQKESLCVSSQAPYPKPSYF